MNISDKFHSATIPDSKLLQGILGLRGLAAFAVVLFHVRHLTGIQVPKGLRFIELDFGYGAQLFFVVSAFSLMYSTAKTTHRPNWTRDYLIKRFFRIAPLFYTVLVCMLILDVRHAINSDSAFPSISTLLINGLFVFGFFPDPKVGLVMAGWTIGVEMIFYLLFPVLLMISKTKGDALILMIVAVLISYVTRAEFHAQYLHAIPQPEYDCSYFTFLPNLYFFSVGIYAYKFEQALVQNGNKLPTLIPLAALITICTLLFVEVDLPLKNDGRLDLICWAFGFGTLCIWQSAMPSSWSANKFFEYLGERSYSIYLLHPLVIISSKGWVVNLYSKLESSIGEYGFFICALAIMVEVLIVAEITYRFIEIPGIKLGRKIIGVKRGISPHAR